MRSPLSPFDLAAPSLCAGCGARGQVLCPACSTGLEAAGPISLTGLAGSAARWRYQGAARALVLGLKLSGRKPFSEPLVDGLEELIRRIGTEARSIAWPPCPPAARRRRGFDHAEVLARGLAERIGVPARPLLQRVGRVADQSELTGAERRTNLSGAFVALPASSVLLVDDVVTTGATLQACAEALTRAGCVGIESVVACSAF